MGEAQAAPPARVIRPPRGLGLPPLRDLHEYRGLLYFLAWRELKVRYKQTIAGVLWAVVRPVATIVVFSYFFGNLLGVPSEGEIPYPVYVFAGLLPWNFFAQGLSESSNSLVGSAPMIKKVYFPRVLIPLSVYLTAVVDFLIALLVYELLAAGFGYFPTLRIAATAPLIVLTGLAMSGLGLVLSALAAQYRDVPFAVPFLVQLGFFATPVIYPGAIMPPDLELIYALNPMVGIIDGFRWALIPGLEFPAATLAVSSSVAAGLFIVGLVVFHRLERTFADLL